MYEPVAIYRLDGTFIGYAIKNAGVDFKLQSTNVYTEDEQDKLEAQLGRLNESVSLNAVWPDARDPEVQAVLADTNFMPVEMHAVEVVDDDRSEYVYYDEPEYDIGTGQPTGRMIKVIDQERSLPKLVYKTIMAPVRPSDVTERTKAACEVVARRRAV